MEVHRGGWSRLHSSTKRVGGEGSGVHKRSEHRQGCGELSKTVDVILVEGFKDLRLGYKVELGGGENLEEVSEKVLEELLECLRKAGRA